MNRIVLPQSKLARTSLFAAAAIVVGGGILLGYSSYDSAPIAKPTRATAFAVSAEPTAKQKSAAKFDYPASTGQLPPTITIEYDAAKDRTRMVLRLRDVAPTSPGYKFTQPELRFTSEFAGQARKPEAGELSVQCRAAVVAKEAGGLAPGSPPGELTIDTKTIALKPAFPGESGYSSKSKPDGVHESLAFRVATSDLIKVAKAKAVSIRLGVATFALTPSQLADVREFVARMDPTP